MKEPNESAREGCVKWLSACLRLGWKTEQLVELEALWWKYHDNWGDLRTDKDGRLVAKKAAP